jgi:SAM-dependent methyltransferase
MKKTNHQQSVAPALNKELTAISSRFDDYYSHLTNISRLGRIYKKYVAARLLYWNAQRLGVRILEVGCGTGSGVLGAYPRRVIGLDINPHSVDYCRAAGFDAHLIGDDGAFPVSDGAYDVCILDNVMEHIEDPKTTLDECHRITSARGGLVIAVPGKRGYDSDADHKRFYSHIHLRQLDERWQLQRMFSIPFLMTSDLLSNSVKQYCLVATYRKISSVQ